MQNLTLQPKLQTTKGNMNNFSLLTFTQKFWMSVVAIILFTLGVTILPRLIFRPTTLTVLGKGKLDFEADKVSMIVARVNSSQSSSGAINEGEAGTQILINAAKSVGGDSIKINKAFYQVEPLSLSGGTSYQVANAFSLEFNDVSKTNEMIKTLYNDGASSVTNVTFGSTREDEISQEAREMAVKNAKAEAKRVAKAAGKRVGKLVAITDDAQQASSVVASENSDSAGFSNVSITKTVSVVYEIW